MESVNLPLATYRGKDPGEQKYSAPCHAMPCLAVRYCAVDISVELYCENQFDRQPQPRPDSTFESCPPMPCEFACLELQPRWRHIVDVCREVRLSLLDVGAMLRLSLTASIRS